MDNPDSPRRRRSVNKLTPKSCELCDSAGGEVLWQNDLCRIVLVRERDYPGFCRVILGKHVSEMTDLNAATRQRLMKAVFATEQALRAQLRPAKINLASLGNMTPHLHWHVIPRFADDRHFPNPVWGKALRPAPVRPVDPIALRHRLQQLLAR